MIITQIFVTTPDDDSRAPMHLKNVALRNRTKGY